jgi:hypothetical protein
MYAGLDGGPTIQLKMSIDPASGLSNYNFRIYATKLPLLVGSVVGLGVADHQHSLVVFNKLPAAGGQSWPVTKPPLCEDM